MMKTSLTAAGNTWIHLADGSVVGMEGDRVDYIADMIACRKVFIIEEPSATFVLNPATIVAACYQKAVEE